ncbi:MAG: helix-turn-helix domain-containing protein, partial [Cytophagales bacterium]|nr:helix-turn-helix domain-containing protein [Cytophagales bacterium]
IATKRSMSAGTIFTHFLKLHQQGRSIDWSRFIDTATYNDITAGVIALNMQKGDRLTPLYEHLGQRFTFEQIRVALLLWEQEQQVKSE